MGQNQWQVNISAVASDNVKLTGIDFAYSIDENTWVVGS